MRHVLLARIRSHTGFVCQVCKSNYRSSCRPLFPQLPDGKCFRHRSRIVISWDYSCTRPWLRGGLTLTFAGNELRLLDFMCILFFLYKNLFHNNIEPEIQPKILRTKENTQAENQQERFILFICFCCVVNLCVQCRLIEKPNLPTVGWCNILPAASEQTVRACEKQLEVSWSIPH